MLIYSLCMYVCIHVESETNRYLMQYISDAGLHNVAEDETRYFDDTV